MRRFKLRAIVALVAVMAMMVLVACGGGGGNGDSGNGGGGAADGAITVQAGPGFVFDPNSITVSAGEEVTITINNADTIDHDFVIDEFNVDSGVLSGGESTTVSFTPSEPGTYEFYCSVPGHRESGMVGTLIVQ